MKINGDAGKGFTLVEMLVVIAIIGCLAALLLPVFSRSQASVRSISCKNRMHQMGLALQSYVSDHDNNYPSYVNPSDPLLNDKIGPENTRYWWAKLLPYYPVKWTHAAYHCPGYRGAIVGEVSPAPPYGSYAYNSRGVSYPLHGIPYHPDLGLGPALFRDRPRSSSESRVQVPSEMLAISESRYVSAEVNGIPGGQDQLICGWLTTTPTNRIYAFDPKRHGKNYNALFCDGHVTGMSPWILFNPAKSAVLWNTDHQPHPELWVP